MPLLLPDSCPRGLSCCSPLSQIVSDSGETFICAGENDGSDRSEPMDVFTLCTKSATVDRREHVDRRDLTDQLSVIAQALSVLANRDG